MHLRTHTYMYNIYILCCFSLSHQAKNFDYERVFKTLLKKQKPSIYKKS